MIYSKDVNDSGTGHGFKKF